MSYQVLARKWRPKKFADVVGQSHVLTVLTNALTLKRIHHAYLLSGTRGVGKTTIARLLAKSLNCESGISAKPCLKCSNCLDIDKGRFIDLIEIDAASRTKVEDTREILDNIQYLPSKGRFKVYLIDEVHMLSKSSFNALLKTLEEPPEHVKFILATTDPQKLPVTILSRCLHLHLSLLDEDLIQNQLSKILTAEAIDFDQAALSLLAKEANGSMRDALSLTDQAIALGNGNVSYQITTEMLGTLDKSLPLELIESLHQKDGEQLLGILSKAIKQGANLDNLMIETLNALHQLSLLQVVKTAFGDYSDVKSKMTYLSEQISPNHLQLFYQIILMGKKELSYAPNQKMGVQMTFLRALAFSPKAYHDQNNVISHNENNTKPNIEPKKAAKIENLPEQTSKTEPALTPQSNEAQPQINNSVSQSKLPSSIQSILASRQKLIDDEANQTKLEVTKQSSVTASEVNPLKKKPLSDIKKDVKPPKQTIEQPKKSDQNLTENTYQWQFSEAGKLSDEAPESDLLNNDNEDFIFKELAQLDPWYHAIDAIKMPPLLKQIAMNSVIKDGSNSQYTLFVRSAVAHLVSDKHISAIAKLYAKHIDKDVSINAVIDDNQPQKTPIESRQMMYQDKLTKAKQNVYQDEKISMLKNKFNAEVIEGSIEPCV